MKIYLTDQSYKFPEHLQLLCATQVMAYDIAKLKEKTTQVMINTAKGLQEIDTSGLFGYNIFPGNIMSALTQWDNEQRAIKAGDTVVQQVYIPPVRSFSQKIIFGVRIKDIIQEQNRVGYSYETLEGHVEKGISTFTIERTAEDKIIFRVHTFSEPANLLTKLLGPFFSLPYQAYCTKQALNNVRRQIEAQL